MRRLIPAFGMAVNVSMRRGGRRRFLLTGALGGAVVTGLGARWLWVSDRSGRTARRRGLVDALLESDTDDCLEVAVRALEEGARVPDLLGAAALLPIVSGGDAGDVHAMATLSPVRQLAAAVGEGEEGLLPVLWAVANAHAWSHKERLAPEELGPVGAGDDLEAARSELDRDASRPRGDVHAAIWAAHAPDVARMAGDEAHLVFASVARTLARRPVLAPEPPGSLLTAMQGSHPTHIFSELAKKAVSARLLEPSDTGPGLHRLTALAALVTIFERASAADRPRILARAIAFMEGLGQRPATGGPDLPHPTFLDSDPYSWPATDPEGAFAAALGAVDTAPDLFLATYRRRLARHGQNAHDFKYWAALTQLSAQLPEARAPLLAALIVSRVARTEDVWPRAEEAGVLLASRGLAK